ncbi:MAG: AAA family ATPase [Gemmataceae bacterium]|nr:AAA family ATPase [Gemmataceae bacterium]
MTDVAPVLLTRLTNHFGGDPVRLPVVTQQFPKLERANLHYAFEMLLAGPGIRHELIGVLSLEHYGEATLARLSRPRSAVHFDEGPVEYADVPLPEDQRLACIRNALYLVHDGETPWAILLSESRHSWQQAIDIEVMAADREVAEAVSRKITRLTHQSKAFRGHALSIVQDCQGSLSIQFHKLPKISRAELILPEPILTRVERHTTSFNRHADRLLAARRHLKRGILLYGPPGTGKTLTAMFLAAQMPGRTVVILTGSAMGGIETACRMAKALAPATVILEDVDLIGTERHHQSIGANALLFELLNEMDGLEDDKDIIFLLTTNRPGELEPALASRPGRIDQAIEIPLPDADCRRRLIDLYGRGLNLEIDDLESYILRTEGVSGSFIKEFLRKAAMFAAEETDAMELVIRDKHLDDALSELLVAGGPLTQSLLGVVARPAPPVCESGGCK